MLQNMSTASSWFNEFTIIYAIQVVLFIQTIYVLYIYIYIFSEGAQSLLNTHERKNLCSFSKYTLTIRKMSFFNTLKEYFMLQMFISNNLYHHHL